MITFESDTDSIITVIPTGSPDLLDSWHEVNAMNAEDWADYFETMYDPD